MRRPTPWLLFIAIASVPIFVSANILSEKISLNKITHKEKSTYRNILVLDGNKDRCLSFGSKNSLQSCILKNDPRKMSFAYTKALLASLYINPDPKNVLVIGMGGGIIPMALRNIIPSASIYTVEVDQSVVNVASVYFGYRQDSNNQVFIDDGRMFVRKQLRQKNHYDLVILDAFDKEFIPEHLLTKEFISQIHELLSENGVLASNTFHNDLFWQYVAATYQSVFGEMLQLKADSNIVLLAQKSTRDLSGADSMKSIKVNAANLDKAFRPFATNSNEILPEISKLEHPTNPSVRVLTDQYSPANLLLKVKLR